MFRKKRGGAPKLTKDDIWGALADRLGGERVMDKKGRRIKQICFTVGDWTVVLDTTVESTGQTSQTYTRLRGLYTEKEPFRFRAYTKSIFSGIGKALGMQDIEVGHPRVDEKWIIKSDSEGRTRSLMILPEVAACLSLVKSGRFEVRRYKRSMPEVRELRFTVLGVVTQPKALEAGVTMMFAGLACLVRAGVSSPEPPEVQP